MVVTLQSFLDLEISFDLNARVAEVSKLIDDELETEFKRADNTTKRMSPIRVRFGENTKANLIQLRTSLINAYSAAGWTTTPWVWEPNDYVFPNGRPIVNMKGIDTVNNLFEATSGSQYRYYTDIIIQVP